MGEAAADGWRLWADGSTRPYEPVTSADDTCADAVVPESGLILCDLVFAAVDTVQGVINAIREGRASVVVHTDDLDPNTPTGRAGDSRAGEIRGTLRATR